MESCVSFSLCIKAWFTKLAIFEKIVLRFIFGTWMKQNFAFKKQLKFICGIQHNVHNALKKIRKIKQGNNLGWLGPLNSLPPKPL